jgi:hypothetical protein
MDNTRLVTALSSILEPSLADALVGHFLQLRRDAASKTLERAVAGKFVEVFVQCLQWLATGKYDAKPNVDDYLARKAENEGKVPEGLRIAGARVARAVYTFRNKRNIAHIGEVDPNTIDLAFTAHAAAWIMAELLRVATGVKMEEAGRLIEMVQAPIGTLVEEIDGVRLVHGKVSLEEELLILLHSHYPDYVALKDILGTTKQRNPKSVGNKLRDLVGSKALVGDTKTGYKLTRPGFDAAAISIQKHTP